LSLIVCVVSVIKYSPLKRAENDPHPARKVRQADTGSARFDEIVAARKQIALAHSSASLLAEDRLSTTRSSRALRSPAAYCKSRFNLSLSRDAWPVIGCLVERFQPCTATVDRLAVVRVGLKSISEMPRARKSSGYRLLASGPK
jgi:hypothetical protein